MLLSNGSEQVRHCLGGPLHWRPGTNYTCCLPPPSVALSINVHLHKQSQAIQAGSVLRFLLLWFTRLKSTVDVVTAKCQNTFHVIIRFVGTTILVWICKIGVSGTGISIIPSLIVWLYCKYLYHYCCFIVGVLWWASYRCIVLYPGWGGGLVWG